MNMPINFEALKAALPFIQTYRDKTFVIKLGGELVEETPALNHLVEQCALLHIAGIRLVMVHGGGNHATELGDRLGVSSEFVAGRRVTSSDMLEITKMSYAGTLNTNIVASFRKYGVGAVGVSGIDGDLLTAVKRPPSIWKDPEKGEREVDFGFVGDVVRSNPSVLLHLLEANFVPVVCSLAADSKGQILNVNADTIASQVAGALKAEKYISLLTVDGVMEKLGDPSTLYSELSAAEVQQLIERGVITKGMLPKLTACLDALKADVPRVHLVNGLSEDGLLKEIFTNEGSGTMITLNRVKR